MPGIRLKKEVSATACRNLEVTEVVLSTKYYLGKLACFRGLTCIVVPLQHGIFVKKLSEGEALRKVSNDRIHMLRREVACSSLLFSTRTHKEGPECVAPDSDCPGSRIMGKSCCLNYSVCVI